tara:strand:+ start:280 stop:633 length:354 start_codon:yes stop_codon:yes gene_type:complete
MHQINPSDEVLIYSQIANGSGTLKIGGLVTTALGNEPLELADALDRVDLRLTWASADERYRVSLNGQNILDKLQIQSFEIEGWELHDPVTGEDREWIVPSPFVSSYELWGLEIRASF